MTKIEHIIAHLTCPDAFASFSDGLPEGERGIAETHDDGRETGFLSHEVTENGVILFFEDGSIRITIG